jgi:4-amino-4-deoxy-L-arabinose transferase-like glycosyltransferase
VTHIEADRRRFALCLAAIAALALLLYVTFLTYAPIYLVHDEVNFGLTAHAIAHTGRDLNGQRLPIVFHIVTRYGRYYTTAIVIYTTALLMRVAPISEWSIRFPTALVGAIDVVLVFLVGRRLFRNDWLAMTAAVFLALMPGHFIHARVAVDTIYPLAFLLAWMYGLARFLDTGRLPWLVLASTMLALGTFSYLAAMIMMPLYFVMTLVVLWKSDARRSAFGVVAASYAWPLVLLLFWFAADPSRYRELLAFYEIGDAAAGVSPWRSLLRLFSYFSLGVRSGVYWDFFNPSLLFFSGDASLLSSTRQVGVFLLPFAALLPLGAIQILKRHRRRLPMLVLAGFLTAPLAALLALEVAIHRALVMLPFAAFLATYGVEWFLERDIRWRRALYALLVLVPLQFASFYRDYMTGYRERSAFWFERNQRGAIEAVIAREPRDGPVPVYLSTNIQWLESNWRLYTLKHGRADLIGRAVFVDPATLTATTLSAGALLIIEGAEPAVRRLLDDGVLIEVARITEPDGQFSYVVASTRTGGRTFAASRSQQLAVPTSARSRVPECPLRSVRVTSAIPQARRTDSVRTRTRTADPST